MQFIGDNYKILYDNDSNTINYSGVLRLCNMDEYMKIKKFMLDIHELNLQSLTLNFKDLMFLNSSGINMLCKFVLDVKKIDKMLIKVIGNKNILWQTKSFKNLKLLWNKLKLDFV